MLAQRVAPEDDCVYHAPSVTLDVEIQSLLEKAREEGRNAGRAEGAKKLTEAETSAALMAALADTADTLSRKTAGTTRQVFSEVAALLRDGEKQVRDELTKARSKKRKSGSK